MEGGKWTASLPCRLTRKETILRTVWLGDLDSRRSGVGAAVTKKKKSLFRPRIEPGRPVLIIIAIPAATLATQYPGYCWSIYGP